MSVASQFYSLVASMSTGGSSTAKEKQDNNSTVTPTRPSTAAGLIEESMTSQSGSAIMKLKSKSVPPVTETGGSTASVSPAPGAAAPPPISPNPKVMTVSVKNLSLLLQKRPSTTSAAAAATTHSLTPAAVVAPPDVVKAPSPPDKPTETLAKMIEDHLSEALEGPPPTKVAAQSKPTPPTVPNPPPPPPAKAEPVIANKPPAATASAPPPPQSTAAAAVPAWLSQLEKQCTEPLSASGTGLFWVTGVTDVQLDLTISTLNGHKTILAARLESKSAVLLETVNKKPRHAAYVVCIPSSRANLIELKDIYTVTESISNGSQGASKARVWVLASKPPRRENKATFCVFKITSGGDLADTATKPAAKRTAATSKKSANPFACAPPAPPVPPAAVAPATAAAPSAPSEAKKEKEQAQAQEQEQEEEEEAGKPGSKSKRKRGKQVAASRRSTRAASKPKKAKKDQDDTDQDEVADENGKVGEEEEVSAPPPAKKLKTALSSETKPAETTQSVSAAPQPTPASLPAGAKPPKETSAPVAAAPTQPATAATKRGSGASTRARGARGSGGRGRGRGGRGGVGSGGASAYSSASSASSSSSSSASGKRTNHPTLVNATEDVYESGAWSHVVTLAEPTRLVSELMVFLSLMASHDHANYSRLINTPLQVSDLYKLVESKDPMVGKALAIATQLVLSLAPGFRQTIESESLQQRFGFLRALLGRVLAKQTAPESAMEASMSERHMRVILNQEELVKQATQELVAETQKSTSAPAAISS